MDSDLVKVETKDGQTFTVLYRDVRDCKVFRDVVEDTGIDVPIPLSEVASAEFVKLMEFRKHYVENPQPPRPAEVSPLKKKHEPTEWETNYVKDMTNDQFHRLMLAAHYVEDQPLLDFLLNEAAYTKVLGKTPDDIRKFFNVNEPPLTEEQLKAIEDDPQMAFIKEEP